MGDQGLRSSEAYWNFVKENKNAILVFAQHGKVPWDRYISSTEILISSAAKRNDANNKFSCERFNTKHVPVPEDIFGNVKTPNHVNLNGGDGPMWMVDRVPEKGALFYRNGEFVKCQTGWDIEVFESNLTYLELLDIEEKRRIAAAAAAARNSAKAPANNGGCCIIL